MTGLPGLLRDQGPLRGDRVPGRGGGDLVPEGGGPGPDLVPEGGGPGPVTVTEGGGPGPGPGPGGGPGLNLVVGGTDPGAGPDGKICFMCFVVCASVWCLKIEF